MSPQFFKTSIFSPKYINHFFKIQFLFWPKGPVKIESLKRNFFTFSIISIFFVLALPAQKFFLRMSCSVILFKPILWLVFITVGLFSVFLSFQYSWHYTWIETLIFLFKIQKIDNKTKNRYEEKLFNMTRYNVSIIKRLDAQAKRIQNSPHADDLTMRVTL